MEQGVVFVDDDELAPNCNLSTPQKWTTDSYRQAAEESSAALCCVSTLTMPTHVKTKTDFLGQGLAIWSGLPNDLSKSEP